jgi:hypothetical protein
MVNSLTMFDTLPEWAIGHERFLNDAVRIWNSVSKDISTTQSNKEKQR